MKSENRKLWEVWGQTNALYTQRCADSAVLPCAAAASGVCAHHDLVFLCDRGDDPVVHHSLRRARVHAFAAAHSAAVFEVNGRMARRPPRPNRHLCRRLSREQGRKTKSCLNFQTAFFVTPYLSCRRSVPGGGLSCPAAASLR